ncbi:hypothetical protein RND71_001462 [Anisodus tanguticus]|uniref:Myosin-12 n=1 Tax=Anisodus tanguticus TaxID=243964 RepID=A0AAE1VYH5_9SOLA|nr:hypothetical protein RND71_001462 [Anisodus tanguticus]
MGLVMEQIGRTIIDFHDSIYPKDTEAPPAGVDDMTKLAYLHEPGVLNNLACRYAINEIYTYTGNILIAVNPFRRLPHLYDIHMMQQYKGAPFGELSPHLFAVADACYRALINEHGSQSILVSGESGAGKTETTKMLMRYLAFMGGRSGTEGRTVEQQVLESNPVLEAFGNAKTVKNNNSSPFSNSLQMILSCHLDDSRNLLQDVKRYKVGNPRSFHYLNQSNCNEVANVDDAREYLETRNAMDVVGIGPEDQEAIFRVVAAILHLGNINFVKGKEVDSSKLKDEKSLFHLKTAAELFMCDAKALEDSLCKRVIVTPDGNITKLLDPAAATSSRDALAKTVYSRLFDWLVDTINNSIGQDPDAKSIIGVLDIYGFESFKINSFEQFCINLTNEKLQQHFNQHVFKMEQEDYTTEEINWSYVEFVDNQDVLDLIEKKPGGIIALLDEACMFPKSTHETFAQKMYQTYKAHKRFSKPKLARTAFTINHYAGDVTYQADHFLDKNKDYVIAEFQALLMDSKCSFVASLFPPLPEESSKQSKFSSIGTRFKQQLQSLMETLSTTEPHYIRCVKPNTVLKPGIFENMNVLNQLRCGGVLEAIRISCAGYPTKRTFDEFLDRFGMLAPDVLDGYISQPVATSFHILNPFQEETNTESLRHGAIGKTKVFLRAGQMAELDARRTEVLAHAARHIQRQIRTYLTQKEFIALKRATIHFQKLWRAQLARVLYEQMRREAASIRIQKHVRSHSARKSYKQLQAAAIVIQTGMRAMAARNEYRQRRRNKAAKIVQTQWRGFHAFSTYKQQKKASISLQCLWRGRLGRKELRKLRMAARDTGALKEAKDKLEKRVEELTWRLDFEKHLRIDLEEAKGQEISKLQKALQEMQTQLDEAHDAVIHEKEAAKIAIEQAPPVIKEVPVIDNTKVEKLTEENNKLEEEIRELKKRVEDFEQSYSEVEKECQATRREAEESQLRVSELQESIERLQLNLSSLESENQVLRQQALVASTNEAQNEALSEEMDILKNKIKDLESENKLLHTQRVVVEQVVSSDRAPKGLETIDNTHPADNGHQTVEVHEEMKVEQQISKENHDILIKCLAEDKRFDKGRPVAACTLYKALLQWRSFEAEKTNIFDRIVHTIRSSIEDQDNTGDLSYWLSTSSTLLFLLQSTIKAGNVPTRSPYRNRSSPTTLFGRMAQGFRSTSLSMAISSGYSGIEGSPNIRTRIEAKYPALLFKQHLTACVEKIYGMIRDNLKKEISPFLNQCIHAPRSARIKPLKGSSRSIHSNIIAKQQASSIHWQNIVNSLDSTLTILSENNVPSTITRKILSQVFSYINVQLFNSLLLRRECCSFSNGEYLKAGLQELESWCSKATEQYAGSSWDELQHIRQAVGFLVLHQKSQKASDEITSDLCPMLSIAQIYRIGTMFWDDKYGAHGLSPEVRTLLQCVTRDTLSFMRVGKVNSLIDSVNKRSTADHFLEFQVISKMRALTLEDSASIPNNTFLLDVDSSIPFSIEEISRSFQNINLSDVEPPPLLRQRSEFQFLLQAAE